MTIFETIFDISYLIFVITIGIMMIIKASDHKQYRLFGIMAIVLGLGDAFHLIPRVYSMWTTGFEANASILGIGQMITSITMTFFYIILYMVYLKRYQIKNHQTLTWTIYGLALLRIILCLLPQNNWRSVDAPVSWGIYRNIPFAIMGLIIIVLFFQKAKEDHEFRFMWLAITLSFGFYIPVVLFADIFPLIGALMMPKTLAYVWVVWMGFWEMKKKGFFNQETNHA